jgi:hypothetical protein
MPDYHSDDHIKPPSLEMLGGDLYREWSRLNVESYGSLLAEPDIKVRRMKLSDGFYKHLPRPSIVINERVALTDWPATLAVLARCIAEQAEAARGRKVETPRQKRRRLARQAETLTGTPAAATGSTADVVLTVTLTRAQVDELARASRAAKGAPITVELHAAPLRSKTQRQKRRGA